MTTQNTIDDLIEAFKADPDYLWSWHCNIAMGFYDAGGDSNTANEGSARFLQNLTDIDVRKHPHWIPSARPAETAQQMKEKLDFLKSKGVCVASFWSDADPDPAMVTMIEAGSEFDDMPTLHKLFDAQDEVGRLKTAIRELLSHFVPEYLDAMSGSKIGSTLASLVKDEPEALAASPESSTEETKAA